MERRREPRFEVDRAVRATILEEPEWSAEGRVVNCSGHGLQLALGAPLPLDAAVRIDLDDAIFLGEVAYCVRSAGGYRVGLNLENALYDVSGIARLMREILDADEQPRPATPAVS